MNEQLRQNIEVTRTYLQMTHPDDLKPARIEEDLQDSILQDSIKRSRIERVLNCPASFYRYLYTEVGREYYWCDRLPWSNAQILTHLNQLGVSVWALYFDGAPAGFFELKQHSDRSTEIAYFGLLPEFTGRGLGKHLLTYAVEQAWGTNPSRVWLHTCTLDSPAALPNYLKRGFQPFKQEKYFTSIEP